MAVNLRTFESAPVAELGMLSVLSLRQRGSRNWWRYELMLVLNHRLNVALFTEFMKHDTRWVNVIDISMGSSYRYKITADQPEPSSNLAQFMAGYIALRCIVPNDMPVTGKPVLLDHIEWLIREGVGALAIIGEECYAYPGVEEYALHVVVKVDTLVVNTILFEEALKQIAINLVADMFGAYHFQVPTTGRTNSIIGRSKAIARDIRVTYETLIRGTQPTRNARRRKRRRTSRS